MLQEAENGHLSAPSTKRWLGAMPWVSPMFDEGIALWGDCRNKRSVNESLARKRQNETQFTSGLAATCAAP